VDSRAVVDSPVPDSQIRIVLNGQRRAVGAGTTLADLLHQLRLEPRHLAVEVNLRLVPREQHAAYTLREGDTLEIVTLVGGG
jgi:sulfur carrier protein